MVGKLQVRSRLKDPVSVARLQKSLVSAPAEDLDPDGKCEAICSTKWKLWVATN